MQRLLWDRVCGTVLGTGIGLSKRAVCVTSEFRCPRKVVPSERQYVGVCTCVRVCMRGVCVCACVRVCMRPVCVYRQCSPSFFTLRISEFLCKPKCARPPCVTFRRVAVSLQGPGQSPVDVCVYVCVHLLSGPFC